MDSLDQSQIAVINSREKRLFVEAPAGYGKTTVMVKKLISDLASNQIPYPKRALALTFSVNAARKMKNDIHKAIAQQKGMRKELVGRVDVMNYHALARQIIMKHGHASLSYGIDVNTLTPMNESHVLAFLHNLKVPFSEKHNKVLTSLSAAVKRADEKLIDSLFEPYCDLVLKTLIQNGCITYNAILLLAIKVLQDDKNTCDLYRSLHPYIIVDEAQDTNLLGYKLFNKLATKRTTVRMFGDSLQRIYGFIGAVPNFIEIACKDFDFKVMELKVNHRFLPGSPMQLLDKNIRENIRNPLSPSIDDESKIPLLLSSSVELEIKQTCKLASRVINAQNHAKIAVLVRSRGYYSDRIVDSVRAEGISCFDGLFSDEDEEYIQFNDQCIAELDRLTGGDRKLSLSTLNDFVEATRKLLQGGSFAHGDSYMQLIEGMRVQVRAEYAGTPADAKYQYVRNVLENKALRHAVNYVDAEVVVTTMHASKGLEWDYVFLPEMMQWVVPAYTTCNDCCFQLRENRTVEHKCLHEGSHVPQSYVDELCLFYVAATRAKRSVTLLASTDRVNGKCDHKTGYLSCFASIPGIKSFTPESLTDIVVS